MTLAAKFAVLVTLFVAIGHTNYATDPDIYGLEPKEKPPLPDGPLFKDLEDREKWTVNYEYLDEKAGNTGIENAGSLRDKEIKRIQNQRNARISKVIIEKLSPYVVAKVGYPGQSDPMAYFYNGILFFSKPSNKQPIRSLYPERQPGLTPAPIETVFWATEKGTLYDFEWLQRNHYIGAQEIDGTACYVFQNDQNKVWIKQKERIPYIWKQGNEIRRFNFEGTITSTSIPKQILHLMEEYSKILKNTQSQPMRGG